MVKKNLQVYQVYFQESQKEELFLDTIPYFNKDLGLLFENDVIINLYQGKKITGDYFGVLSWKVRKKNSIRRKKLGKLINLTHDLYSFTYDIHDVIGYGELCHPGFKTVFRELLDYLQIDRDIRPNVGLYQNAIIAKSSIFIDYIENFLMPTVEFFKKCSNNVRDILFSDSGYRGVKQDELEKKIGTKHYTFHTFVLERLWSVYFHQRRRKHSINYYLAQLNPNSSKAKKVKSKGKIHKIRF